MPAVHVDDLRAGALVKVVDVLGDEHQPLAARHEVALEPDQRMMGGVGLGFAAHVAPPIVEAVHELGIVGEGFRRRQRLRVVLLPKAAGIAEGADTAFRRHAGTRQDEDVHAPRNAEPGNIDPPPCLNHDTEEDAAIAAGRRPRRAAG